MFDKKSTYKIIAIDCKTFLTGYDTYSELGLSKIND